MSRRKSKKNVINLRKERIKRSDDNSVWNPEECAEEFIEDIKSGKIKPKNCLIVFQIETEEGNIRTKRYTSKCDGAEMNLMIDIAKCLIMDDMKL